MNINPCDVIIPFVDHDVDEKAMENDFPDHFVVIALEVWDESIMNDNVLSLLFDSAELVGFIDDQVLGDYRNEDCQIKNEDAIAFRIWIDTDEGMQSWSRLMYAWLHQKLSFYGSENQ